jgi:hypothetical protein
MADESVLDSAKAEGFSCAYELQETRDCKGQLIEDTISNSLRTRALI